MMLELIPTDAVQGDLWSAPDSVRSTVLMCAVDGINAAHGRATVLVRRQGYSRGGNCGVSSGQQDTRRSGMSSCRCDDKAPARLIRYPQHPSEIKASVQEVVEAGGDVAKDRWLGRSPRPDRGVVGRIVVRLAPLASKVSSQRIPPGATSFASRQVWRKQVA